MKLEGVLYTNVRYPATLCVCVRRSKLVQVPPAIASRAARIDSENIWQSGHQFTPYQSTFTTSDAVAVEASPTAKTSIRASSIFATLKIFNGAQKTGVSPSVTVRGKTICDGVCLGCWHLRCRVGTCTRGRKLYSRPTLTCNTTVRSPPHPFLLP